MNPSLLKDLLSAFREGEFTLDEVVSRLKNLPFEDIGFAKIDHHRHLRRGFPEVVYSKGKSPEQLKRIVETLAGNGSPVLLTRCDRAGYEKAAEALPDLVYHPVARCAAWQPGPISPAGHPIVVCTAGTTDQPVAEEAAVTAEIMGNPVKRIYDVGVAGLHRLLAHRKEFATAGVIIAVAGMEGALPGVLGGLVDVPVIGVPTSVGYGTSFGGIAALLSMLNTCASGVTVVNIDNGFGAAYAATLMNRSRRPHRDPG